jgi:hypothetical protein
MRRFGSQYSTFAAASVLCAFSLRPTIASAEVVLHDADGWRVFTTGRGDAHYQLLDGDGDPHSMNKLVGGQLLFSSQDQNNHVLDSRIRSGFVGAQIGFGVSDKFTETLQAKAYVSLWLNGIDSHKGNPPYNKDIDMREAWGSLNGSFGTFVFGRTYSIFGSASGEVNLYAYEFGVGHPCVAEGSTIGCGSTGAGPLYAAPNAQFRYITPRLGGVELQVSLADPSATPDYQITHYPRVDGDINYLLPIGDNGKIVVKGQGWAQQLTKVNTTADGTTSTTAWGAMGVARFELGGLRVGGGAWTGKGIGTNVTLQQDDPGRPLAHDLPGGTNPTTGQPLAGDQLRSFRGLFANAVYDYHGTALAVGGGNASVQETLSDGYTASTSLLRQNLEYHAVLTRRIYAVVLSAEFMHWKSEWYRGETQIVNFIGAGSTFVW